MIVIIMILIIFRRENRVLMAITLMLQFHFSLNVVSIV